MNNYASKHLKIGDRVMVSTTTPKYNSISFKIVDMDDNKFFLEGVENDQIRFAATKDYLFTKLNRD